MSGKDIEFRVFEPVKVTTYKELIQFFTNLKIGTVLKCNSVSHTRLYICLGNEKFVVLEAEREKTVKDLIDDLLLNPMKEVETITTVKMMLDYLSIGFYRQEELLLWCMKYRLLGKDDNDT